MRCHYTNNNTPGIYEYGKHYLWLALSERDDNQVPSFRKNKDEQCGQHQNRNTAGYIGTSLQDPIIKASFFLISGFYVHDIFPTFLFTKFNKKFDTKMTTINTKPTEKRIS